MVIALHVRRKVRLADASAPGVLGIDDWSIREGRTYRAIPVDLERHRLAGTLRVLPGDGSAPSMAD